MSSPANNEAASVPFQSVAIIGAGLIGGSFAKALKDVSSSISISVFDRPEVLRQIEEQNLGWRTAPEMASAVADADLIYIALPVRAAIFTLPQITRSCRRDALITDACSTKIEIVKAAQRESQRGAEFLGGHPITGKEKSGIEYASANLFRGAKYALIGGEGNASTRARQFSRLLSALGAEPVWLDAETHDWAMAVVSQMPQLLAMALARVVSDETDETGMPLPLAGAGLRDLLRIAGSPYEMWRDICLTNGENIARSLDRVTQAIDFLRKHLSSRELESEFRAANDVYERLKEI